MPLFKMIIWGRNVWKETSSDPTKKISQNNDPFKGQTGSLNTYPVHQNPSAVLIKYRRPVKTYPLRMSSAKGAFV